MDLRPSLFRVFERKNVTLAAPNCYLIKHGQWQRFAIMVDQSGKFQVEGRWEAYDTPEKTYSLHETLDQAIAQIKSEMVAHDEQGDYIYQEFPSSDAETSPLVQQLMASGVAVESSSNVLEAEIVSTIDRPEMV